MKAWQVQKLQHPSKITVYVRCAPSVADSDMWKGGVSRTESGLGMTRSRDARLAALQPMIWSC